MKKEKPSERHRVAGKHRGDWRLCVLGYSKLETTILNEGLKEIGYGAFLGTKRKKIRIPSAVEEIDAFVAQDVEFEIAEGN